MPLDVEYGKATCALGFPLLDEQAREIDDIFEKAEDGDIQYKKMVVPGFEYAIDKENTDVSIISDKSVDSHGHIVEPSGIDWSLFRKNPVVSFNHDYNTIPIGKSLWQKRVNDTWKAKTLYATEPPEGVERKDWLPNSVWHMVRNGFLPAKSVGILYREVEAPSKELKEKNPGLWLIAKKSAVVEYSIVPVGANSNAITELVSKSLFNLPEDVINSVFPFLKKEVKQVKNDEQLLSIKGIRGEKFDDRVAVIKAIVNDKVSEMLLRTPEIVDNVIDTLKGKV